ncbi:MAG: methyltransferase [Stappiaceae bacterium]
MTGGSADNSDFIADDLPPVTIDRFLGGRFEVEQPEKGRHRSGMDAILLAAAIPQDAKGKLVDLGAGAGVAGMAAACRIPDLSVLLVERDPVMLSLSRRSLNRPGNAHIQARVSILPADITAKGSQRHAAGLTSAIAEHVILNPPYYDNHAVSQSPAEKKADAHVLGTSGIEPWIRTAADILTGSGTMTVIYRADGLADLLAVMSNRFGAITMVPVFPREGQAATRIIIQAKRNSRAPTKIRRGVVMHQSSGSTYTEEVEAILRDGQALDIAAL